MTLSPRLGIIGGAVLALLSTLIIGFGVIEATRSDSSPNEWHYHATFYSTGQATHADVQCIAVGQIWGSHEGTRIVYSGVGAPECWQDTNGAVVETVYAHDQVWSFDHSSDQESSRETGVAPFYAKDYSDLAGGSGAWCDPSWYSCVDVGSETIANHPVVHVRVESQASPDESTFLDFWIDPETGRALRQTTGDGATTDSDFRVVNIDFEAGLPDGVFDEEPLP